MSRGACIPWGGALSADGYGIQKVNGQSTVAHRVAYEREVGPIATGMVIDHLCRNRACVNTAHMEVVTARENTLRGVSAPAVNAQKTHCKRGHEFTPENTQVRSDDRGRVARRCWTCILAHRRATHLGMTLDAWFALPESTRALPTRKLRAALEAA